MSDEKTLRLIMIKKKLRQLQDHIQDYDETVENSIYHGYDKQFIYETKHIIQLSLINIQINFNKEYPMSPVLQTLIVFENEHHIEILMVALLRLNANILHNDLWYNINNKIFRHPRCSHSNKPVNAVIKFSKNQYFIESNVLAFLCNDCKKFIEYYKKYHDENELQNLLYYKSFHPLNYCTYM